MPRTMTTAEHVLYGDDPDWQARRQEEGVADTMTLGLTDARGQRARQGATDLILGVEQPRFSQGQIEAPDYAGDFNAEMYSDPVAAQAAMADESPEGRAAQLQALQQMQEFSNQAADSSSALGRQQAMQDASQFSQGREGLIRQDAMRRGQVGGAADMIARQQSAQAASNQNLNAGLQSAQQSALQRLQGMQAGGALAGQLRGGDQAMAFRNQDAINTFNMANNRALNATRAANTDLRNNTGTRNLDARQGFLNNTADASNQNLRRGDTLAQSGFDNQMTQATAAGNALSGQANGYAQQGQNARNGAQTLASFFGYAMDDKKK